MTAYPAEPPIGTTVRPEPDDGQRWYRTDAWTWELHNYPVRRACGYDGPVWLTWTGVMDRLGGAVVVPTPDGIAGPEECARRARPDAAALREQIREAVSPWLDFDTIKQFTRQGREAGATAAVMAVLAEHGVIGRGEPPYRPEDDLCATCSGYGCPECDRGEASSDA